MRRDKLPEKANEIYRGLKTEGLEATYDEKGSVGKIYARADEIGIPYVITIDYQTLEDNTVTIRDRDTTKQIRVETQMLPSTLRELIKGTTKFSEAGTLKRN